MVNNMHKKNHRFNDFQIRVGLFLKNPALVSSSFNGPKKQDNSGRGKFI